jgi:hypothetical protein
MVTGIHATTAHHSVGASLHTSAHHGQHALNTLNTTATGHTHHSAHTTTAATTTTGHHSTLKPTSLNTTTTTTHTNTHANQQPAKPTSTINHQPAIVKPAHTTTNTASSTTTHHDVKVQPTNNHHTDVRANTTTGDKQVNNHQATKHDSLKTVVSENKVTNNKVDDKTAGSNTVKAPIHDHKTAMNNSTTKTKVGDDKTSQQTTQQNQKPTSKVAPEDNRPIGNVNQQANAGKPAVSQGVVGGAATAAVHDAQALNPVAQSIHNRVVTAKYQAASISDQLTRGIPNIPDLFSGNPTALDEEVHPEAFANPTAKETQWK